MSIFRTFLFLVVVVVAGIYGLAKFREKAPARAALVEAPIAAGTRLSGEPAVSSVSAAAASAAGAIALANDPRRTAPPTEYAQSATLDPERVKLYQAALDEIELDGCNGNGTFAVRLRGEKRPRMLRSGAVVELPDGLKVTLRMHGYPNCKVQVADGKNAIGEIAGF
jgi:hypothetical protein